MQCPVFVLATDEGHSAVTKMFGKNKIHISAGVRRKSYSVLTLKFIWQLIMNSITQSENHPQKHCKALCVAFHPFVLSF